MTVIESINKDLLELDNAKLVKAASFIRSLLPKATVQKRVDAINALHGSLSGEEGEAFEAAVLGGDEQLTE